MRTHPLTVLAALTSMALFGLTAVAVDDGKEASRGAGPSRAASPRVGQLVVTPDDQFSGNLDANDPSEVASFTVEYRGNELDDPFIEVSLSCSPTGPVTCGSISESSPLHLDLNTPVNVDVTFSTGSSIGQATIMLAANGSGYFDSGWRNYQVGPPVQVSQLSIPSSVVQHSEGNEATFEVQNGTASTQFYNFECEWGGSGACADPFAVQIGAGAADTITVTFDAGALSGTHSLGLTATQSGSSNTDSDAGNVTVAEFLSVNAVPKHAVVYARPDVQRIDTFVVRFPGQAASSFDISVSCPGGSGARSCTISPPTDAVKSVGDTAVNVVVQYTAGNDGVTSEVSLTAEKVGASWITHTGTLSVVAAGDIVLDVESANPGLELNRGDCLSIAAGPGSIVCDDYQFVYPFLPVTRMNTPRQTGLIYNSSIAHPQGRTGLNIVLPLGVAEPDSVRVEHVVAGVSVETTTYPDFHYRRGEEFRVSNSWTFGVGTFEQLVDYDFIVTRYDAGVVQAVDTASGKLISLDKRRWFGRGWWLAGYEHVRPRTDPDLGEVLIWTGGDASARVYVETAPSSDVFVGWSRSLPDTITYNGTDEYVRHVLGGGHVSFNSSGYHTHTVNANGDTTFFDHDEDGPYTVPISIRAPTPSGPDTIFKLDYEDTSGRLETVEVRNGAGGWSTYEVYATSTSGNQYQIDSIVDPAGGKVRMWWEGGSPGYRLDSIMDLRGATTHIGWSWNAVRDVTIAAPPDTIVIDYLAASPVGLSKFGSNDYRPRTVEGWRALLDGPLPGDADTTGFFTTGWGAVRGIRDADGNSTWIDREDPDFVGLPTRVRHPNGWEVTASYDSVGLPDTIIDRSNGATTTYAWNTTWRQPSQITSPEGLITTFRYDGVTGNLEARVVAGQFKDSLRYNGDNQVDQSVDPLGAVTAFGYDANGNMSTVTPPDSVWAHYFRDARGSVTKVEVTPEAGPVRMGDPG